MRAFFGFAREESGGVIVFVAIALPMFLAMIAFVYDIGLARLHDTRLQIAADAAAMAAAADTAVVTAARAAADADDLSAARALALPVARGVADANYREVFDDQIADSIELVHWDAANRQALPVDIAGGLPANAVAVVTRRNAQSNTVLPYVFARAAGLQGDGFSLAARAVALFEVSGGGCSTSAGIFADGWLKLDTSGPRNEDYYKVACLYGAARVDIPFPIRMDDESAIISSGPIDDPYDELAFSDPIDLPLPGKVDDILEDVEIEFLPPTEAQLKDGKQQSSSSSISGTNSNRHFSGNGNITIGNNANLENVTIWTTGDVIFGNKVTLNNVKIRARNVSFGEVQRANDLSVTDVQVWAIDSINVSSQKSSFSNIVFYAVNGDVKFSGLGTGSGNRTTATTAEIYAGNDVIFDNNVGLSKISVYSKRDVVVGSSNNPNLDIDLGVDTNCSLDVYDNYVIAGRSVNIGANTKVNGVQIGSKVDLVVEGDPQSGAMRDFGTVFIGASAEVGGNANIGAKTKVFGEVGDKPCEKQSKYGPSVLPPSSGSADIQRVLLVQ